MDKNKFDWEVRTPSVYPNLSIPFHFRVVNPEDMEEEQKAGGIWSCDGFFMTIGQALEQTTTEMADTPPPTPNKNLDPSFP